MKNTLCIWLYNLGWVVLLPLVLVRLACKAVRQPGYWKHWNERLAMTGYAKAELWVHAVSLGEAGVAVQLLDGLLASYPARNIMLSCLTPSGRQVLDCWAKNKPGVRLRYLPYDQSLLVRRALLSVRPRLLVCVETELWPGLLSQAVRLGIPCLLANARLSAISAKRIRRLYYLFANQLAGLLVLAQDKPTARRFARLGCPSPRISGNIKFDRHPAPKKPWVGGLHWLSGDGYTTLVFASTRMDEVELFAETCAVLVGAADQAMLRVIWVPRHPHACTFIERRLERLGVSVRLIAVDGGLPKLRHDTSRVWLVSGFGLVSSCCALADLVVMGGSFGSGGSQNVIEPAQLGKCVVCGPSQRNFAQAHMLLQRGGGGVYVSPGDLSDALIRLLKQPEERNQIGAQARRLMQGAKGGMERQVGVLVSLLTGK